jgi:hypothetical protein
MSLVRVLYRLALVVSIPAFPASAWAQTGTDPGGSSGDWSDALAVMAVIVISVIGIGVVVKLYDVKRRRTEKNAALQSLLSETLLLDRSITSLPVAVFVSGSSWPRSAVSVAVKGSVPTSEMRDTVMGLIRLETSRREPSAQIEDRLVVNTTIGKHMEAVPRA